MYWKQYQLNKYIHNDHCKSNRNTNLILQLSKNCCKQLLHRLDLRRLKMNLKKEER